MKPSDNRGMASFAVFLFSLVAMMILIANFRLNRAVAITSDAFDSMNSQVVEKNGVAQIVKESILALRETAPAASSNALQVEIQNRLNGLALPAGVTLTLHTPVPVLPAHAFFPATPPAATALAYYSASPRGIAGMGNLLTSFVTQGAAADLGRINFTFARANADAPNDNRSYAVAADLFSVPLTNVDVIAYGLPSSGSIPLAAPAVPMGTFGAGVSTLIVTSNNPAHDPTAYPDLFAASGPETLPYQFRNAVSFAWNAYEYLWSPAYQQTLVSAAAGEADPGNAAPSVSDPNPATGAVYDFSGSNNPTIAGLTGAGSIVTLDCGAVQSPVIALVDAGGIGQVTIRGSATGGQPFVLLIRNTAGSLGQTRVTFTGDNLRPAIFYLENAQVAFGGAPQIQGALFLDPTTTAAGAVTWFGHLSFYGPASPLGTLTLTLNDSPSVKTALSALAPRVLLVSTTSTR